MEIVYLMAGKRFKAKKKDVRGLNDILAPYKLISNLNSEGTGCYSVRRTSDSENTHRYAMECAWGESADKERTEKYDVCVGIIIADTGYGKNEVAETELSQIENVLNETREDIPDAKILVFSHWS